MKATRVKPRIYPAMWIKCQAHRLRNRKMDWRPITRFNPIRIKTSELVLPNTTEFRDTIPYLHEGDVINWVVEYENTMPIRMPFSYEQTIDGQLKRDQEVLSAKSSTKISVPYTFTEATTLTGVGVAIFRGRILDYVEKTFDIGLFVPPEPPIPPPDPPGIAPLFYPTLIRLLRPLVKTR